jgi:colanic acid/amylovoran biosynthesis glycosyltransferase
VKLLYVTATFPFGFEEPFLEPEVASLVAAGSEVKIVPRSPRREIVHDANAPWSRSTIRDSLISLDILSKSLWMMVRAPRRALLALGWLFRSRTPRILLKNLAVYPKGLWLARIASDCKADHIHAHWAGTTATMAAVAAQVVGVSWSITCHSFEIAENNLLSAKLSAASFIRFISECGMGEARSCLGGTLPPDRVFVLHMGIRIPPREEMLPEGTASPVVLCPASLLPVKGHRYLIDAFSLLARQGRAAELWLAGDGELRDQLASQVGDLGLGDRVRFLGAVPHQKLIDFYRDGLIGVVVVPSVDLGGGDHEGIPVSLMEAMSYGVPVVSTTTGGIPELLRGGAGLLVPPADPAALANALALSMEDKDLRSRLRRLGRERVEAEFDAPTIASELTRRMESAVDGRQ